MATFNVNDTVSVDGKRGRWVVDDILPATGHHPDRVVLSRAYRVGRDIRSESIVIHDSARVSLVRRGNRDDDLANEVLAAAGLPLI